MAKATEKVRHVGIKALGASTPYEPLSQKSVKEVEKLNKKAEKKGLFVESTLSRNEDKADAEKKTQEESIALQSQKEQMALLEADDVAGRRKLLRKTGGRQSLIASR